MSCVITGKKPSQLPDPVVAVTSSNSWLVIETSDGRVCRIRPADVIALGSGAGEFYGFVVRDFSGTTLSVPNTAAANNGKLPANKWRVFIKTNGQGDYPNDGAEVFDFTITYNGGATPDDIVFTNARVSEDIMVQFYNIV